jgi:ribosome-associated protein
VEVQFDIGASAALGPRQRARLLERYGPTVRAAASESRSQSRNRQLALERLASRLAEGLRVDPDRRPTRPTKGSQVRRVEEKRHRAEIKRRRRPPGEHDE